VFIYTSGLLQLGTKLALKTRQKCLRICFAASTDVVMQHIGILLRNTNIVNNF